MCTQKYGYSTDTFGEVQAGNAMLECTDIVLTLDRAKRTIQRPCAVVTFSPSPQHLPERLTALKIFVERDIGKTHDILLRSLILMQRLLLNPVSLEAIPMRHYFGSKSDQFSLP